MYASEGHTTRATWSIVITNSVPEVRQRAVELWRSCFEVDGRITAQRDRCGSVVVASKAAVEVLAELGCGARASEKRVPRGIMGSCEPVVLAFLRGLWLDAYTSVSGMPRWGLCLDSGCLLDDVQTLLRRLGT